MPARNTTNHDANDACYEVVVLGSGAELQWNRSKRSILRPDLLLKNFITMRATKEDGTYRAGDATGKGI